MIETNEMIAMIIACASHIGKDVQEHGEAKSVYVDDDADMITVCFADDTSIDYYASETFFCSYNLMRDTHEIIEEDPPFN